MNNRSELESNADRVMNVEAPEPPPGSQLECRRVDGQMILSILPGSGISVGFLGCFPPLFLAAAIFLTVAAMCVGIGEEERWFIILLLCLSWIVTLGTLYPWLRGRFGTTQVSVERGRLVTDFTLFGRTRTKEYRLDVDSVAHLVADFHAGGTNDHRGDPVYHVQVETAGRPAKFGTFLSREEKDWIVAQINRHLRQRENAD